MNPGLSGCVAGVVAILGLAIGPATATGQGADPWAQCRPAGPLQPIRELGEASGLALSRTVPGRLWVHNDSGKPVLYAIDATGSVTAAVSVRGATVEDWEAVAVGPCGTGSCLYVGDIGDNKANRRRITIYRAAEPAPGATSVVAEAIHATYPNGPRDAEALLASPDGTLFIVTKGEPRPVGLYRFPRDLAAGTTVTLERVGQPRPGKGEDITDGTVSPDGAWVALRTKTALILYTAKDFFAGSWRETRRIDLTPLREPQGEGVAIGGAGSTIFVATEGAGAGGLGRLTCTAGG